MTIEDIIRQYQSSKSTLIKHVSDEGSYYELKHGDVSEIFDSSFYAKLGVNAPKPDTILNEEGNEVVDTESSGPLAQSEPGHFEGTLSYVPTEPRYYGFPCSVSTPLPSTPDYPNRKTRQANKAKRRQGHR